MVHILRLLIFAVSSGLALSGDGGAVIEQLIIDLLPHLAVLLRLNLLNLPIISTVFIVY